MAVLFADFMECLFQNIDRTTQYVSGKDGTGGKCDCIGLIIGAIRLAGGSWTGTHGSNYAVRNEMRWMESIGSASDLAYGDIVYKAYAPGHSSWNLPSSYKYSDDQNDYYHVGVVTQVNPLRITHCTTVAGGIKVDTSLGAWKYRGLLKKVDYTSTEEPEPDVPDVPVPENPTLAYYQNGQHIATVYRLLYEHIGNVYGVCGLMGNLKAESGIYPNRVQGDIPYSQYSFDYTAQVDNGTISRSEFINNGPGGGGYGLAQWTYSTRKAGLYDMWQSGGYSSIGNLVLAIDYLVYELKNSYSGVYNTLKNATSVREASDKVLHDFENPADQSEAVEEARCAMGEEYYLSFKNWTPGKPQKRRKSMSLLLLLTATRARR